MDFNMGPSFLEQMKCRFAHEKDIRQHFMSY